MSLPARLALCALIGVAATLATFFVPYQGPEVLVSNECPTDDDPHCRGRVLAAGLPLYWVSDSPWVSARNALTPFLEDPVRWWAFGVDVLAWALVAALVGGLAARIRSEPRRASPEPRG